MTFNRDGFAMIYRSMIISSSVLFPVDETAAESRHNLSLNRNASTKTEATLSCAFGFHPGFLPIREHIPSLIGD